MKNEGRVMMVAKSIGGLPFTDDVASVKINATTVSRLELKERSVEAKTQKRGPFLLVLVIAITLQILLVVVAFFVEACG